MYYRNTDNTYAYCQRCGTRQPVSTMKWQAGFLICTAYRCVDKNILGRRDVLLAAAASRLPGQELQPVPKVTGENSPDGGFEQIDFEL